MYLCQNRVMNVKYMGLLRLAIDFMMKSGNESASLINLKNKQL